MKTVYITGATAGIGMATARKFAGEGWRLIITGRRADRLQQLEEEFSSKVPVFSLQQDIRRTDEVIKQIQALPAEFSQIDVLVNNAGLAASKGWVDNIPLEELFDMVDTNIKGLLATTRHIMAGMKQRKAGHIINIGSTSGAHVYPGSAVYAGTKAFVNHLSTCLRPDLLGSNVRVTSIEPGMVETEFSIVRSKGDLETAKKLYEGMRPLKPENVADAVFWAVMQPPHVNVSKIEIFPTDQAHGAFNIYRDDQAKSA